MSRIVKLSDRTHVLKRPARYIGSVVPNEVERYYIENEKIEFGKINYVPALLKIIREILDNSIDAIIKSNVGDLVKINMDTTKISVEDNSTGIPIKYIHDEHGNQIEKYAPEAVWTELKTGSNFDDDGAATQIGQNGEGSTLTNIFSTKFIGETDDGNHHFKLECFNNMDPEKTKTILNKSKKVTGTKVIFYPDLEKLHLGDKIPEFYQDLVKFELLYLAITYPEIDFKFNNKLLKIKSARQLYNQYFDDVIVLEETEDAVIGISPSDDGYRFIHFINGLNVFNGGKILDYAEDKILGALTDRIKVRIKDIKKSDVKNKITFHCILKNIPNPRFADQIKSESVNLPSQYPKQASEIINISKSKFIDRVYKTKEIVSSVIDLFKAKQMIKDRKDLEKTIKKVKKPVKYWPAVQSKKYLIISEGDSAITSIINGVGRKEYGFYPIKGKTSNVLKDAKKIKADKELLEIAKILGINFEDQDTLDYENIVIAADMDNDGSHIISLLLGYFYLAVPKILGKGNFYRFLTPLAITYKANKIDKMFFSYEELYDYKGTNIEYKKGLGSLTEEEWEELFSRYSFEDLLLQIKLNTESDVEILKSWLEEERQYRKKIIEENIDKFNLDNA